MRALALKANPLHRIGQNAASIVAGQVGITGAQAMLVALGTRSLGIEMFGQWLIISAVPAYMAMADLGIVASTNNRLQHEMVLGRQTEAQAVLRSALGAISWIFVTVGLAAVFLVALFGSQLSALFTHFSANELMIISAAFCLDFAISCYVSVIIGVLRAFDRFATSMLMFNFARTLQTVIFAVLLALDWGIVHSLAASIFTKLPIAVAIVWWAKSRSKWAAAAFVPSLRSGISKAISDARGPLALTLSNAIHYQGFVAVAGLALGSQAAVLLYTIRSLVRLPIIIINVLGASLAPQLVAASALKKHSEVRQLLVGGWAASLAVAVVCSPMLLVWAESILKWWTGNSIHLDQSLLIAASVDMIFVCLATISAHYLIVFQSASRSGLAGILCYTTALVMISSGLAPSINSAFITLAICNGFVACISVADATSGTGSKLKC